MRDFTFLTPSYQPIEPLLSVNFTTSRPVVQKLITSVTNQSVNVCACTRFLTSFSVSHFAAPARPMHWGISISVSVRLVESVIDQHLGDFSASLESGTVHGSITVLCCELRISVSDRSIQRMLKFRKNYTLSITRPFSAMLVSAFISSSCLTS